MRSRTNVVLYKVEKGRRTDLPVKGEGRTYGKKAQVPSGQWSTLPVVAARPIVTYLGAPPVRLDTLGRGGYFGVSAGCNYRRIPRDRVNGRAVAAPPGKK